MIQPFSMRLPFPICHKTVMKGLHVLTKLSGESTLNSFSKMSQMVRPYHRSLAYVEKVYGYGYTLRKPEKRKKGGKKKK